MNTDTRHILGHFETPRSGFDYFDDWYHSYTSASLKDRITSPSVVVTTLLVLGSFAYQTVYRQGYVPPILRLVWNLLVFIIPARILYMLDEVLNPDLDFPSMRITKPRTHAAKSETLRRVLCLDRAGDLLKSVSGLGLSSFNSLSHVASALGGDKIFESNPPGLVNYNNSCYQNSILQGLASLKQLPHYLSTVLQERSCDAAPAYTVEALRKLIADLHSFSNSGKTLGAPGALQRMNSWQQQDAQEYYSKVMDEIDKELAKYVRRTPATALEFDWSRDDSSSSQHSDDSGYYSSHSQSKFAYDIRSTRNPLEGLIAQRVACVRCGYCEGLSMIPFNCLTLNLGNSQEHNVYERLDHYTKLELIEGVQCNKCTLLDYRERLETLIHTHPNLAAGVQQRIATVEGAIEEDDFDDEAVRARCKVPQRSWVSSVKTKQACIARPPPCLVLHMNRSVFDETTGFQYKNYAAVRFPTLLDLGPWVVGSAMNQTSEDADSDVEEWATNPRVSMVAGGGRLSRVSGPIYELRAVVAHMGRHENGHYVCYRKHPKSTPPREVRFGQEPTPPPPQLASEDDTAADSPSPNAKDTVEYVGSDNEQWWRFSDQQIPIPNLPLEGSIPRRRFPHLPWWPSPSARRGLSSMASSGDQSPDGGSAARASKLRYPLRSASRGKAAADAPPTVSAPRRAKPSSDVSKSMCVLDLSGKDKSAKPPRRHSIQTKPGASPRPAPSGTVTPVSGIRTRRLDSQGRFDTPTSEVSMSTARRKFSTLSSISYWMTQIRLAEAASKHSVALGFFKLALESECELVDQMREELKFYVVRHGLAAELEDPVKDILQVYDIVGDFEKLKISAEPSQQPKKSDKAARTTTNVSPNGNLKPRSLNSDATQNKEAGKKENIQKLKPDAKVRGSYNRNPAKSTTAKEVSAKNTGKKTKKQAKGQEEVFKGDGDAFPVLPDHESVDVVKEVTHEDKENMVAPEMPMDAGIPQEI